MSKRNFIYFIIIFCIALIMSSCVPSIRFTSDNKSKESNSYSENASQNKSNSNKKKTSNKNYSEDKTKYSKIPKNEKSRKSYDKSNISTEFLNGTRKQIISEAQSWIGTPYSWGGESRSGADCSGFVMEVFKTAGISLPRTAAEQYTRGKAINITEAKSGDLVFFSNNSSISHVGIYIGNNNILHSSSSRGVVVQNLSTMGINPSFAGVKSVITK